MRNITATKSPVAPAPHAPKVLPWLITGLAVGLLIGGYWGRKSAAGTAPADAAREAGLSEATRMLLHKLDSPVELRLYVPSSSDDLPHPLGAYASRVKQLLSEYEREAGGKIELRSFDPLADPTAKANAATDGVLAFAGKDGAACYLGISVVQDGRRQTLPQLSPEWEAALESDVSRAIARVVASPTPVASATRRAVTPSAEPIDPAVTEEVLRTIPDLESRSFDEASKVLREAALAEFTAQANEMQGKVGEAQRHVLEAQQKNSERDHQAAVQELQRIQAEQTEKLKAITARLQSRIQALGQLKGQRPSAQ